MDDQMRVYTRATETPQSLVEVLTNVGFGAEVEGDHALITNLYGSDPDDVVVELGSYGWRTEKVTD
jgi:hypothetical protein